jgi:hypothetical protein
VLAIGSGYFNEGILVLGDEGVEDIVNISIGEIHEDVLDDEEVSLFDDIWDLIDILELNVLGMLVFGE